MISYQAYKVIHLIGIFLTLAALAGLALAAANGATKQTNSARKLISASHGLGLFIVLLGGFRLPRLGLGQARHLDRGGRPGGGAVPATRPRALRFPGHPAARRPRRVAGHLQTLLSATDG
jgi:hypothetical protein